MDPLLPGIRRAPLTLRERDEAQHITADVHVASVRGTMASPSYHPCRLEGLLRCSEFLSKAVGLDVGRLVNARLLPTLTAG